jgi:hypothetical protein
LAAGAAEREVAAAKALNPFAAQGNLMWKAHVSVGFWGNEVAGGLETKRLMPIAVTV